MPAKTKHWDRFLEEHFYNNCSLWEDLLFRVNPATLIWVQVTQIFKKKQKKKGKLNFCKRATKVSTALRCFVFVCCFFFFHRCGPWLLRQEPDVFFRHNKSTQPVPVGEASSLLSSPAISRLKHQPGVLHPPLNHSFSSSPG